MLCRCELPLRRCLRSGATEAGGLGNIDTAAERERKKQMTANDVLFIGPRSWTKASEHWRQRLPELKKRGWLIIVFAAQNGVPEDLPSDHVFDNGAETGGHDERAVNSLVNITQGWLWCCELVSALTRHRKRPAVSNTVVGPVARVIRPEAGLTEDCGLCWHR